MDIIVETPPSRRIIDPKEINSALQEVIKRAMVGNGIIHGIHQCCKALNKRQALLCILADSSSDINYKKLIQALCREQEVPLLRVDSHKKLGEWSGLCKFDKTGRARHVRNCSCLIIKDFGEETVALDLVFTYLRMCEK